MTDPSADQIETVRPVHADPKDYWQYDEDENPTDHSVGWALSWGCQLTFGFEGDQLSVTVATSDRDKAAGITKRTVTPEAVTEYANRLLALAGAVPGTPAATATDHRVATDNDGALWDEVGPGVFKYRSADGDGDELSLAQLDECYGLAALSPAPGNEPRTGGAATTATGEPDINGYFDEAGKHHCPLGHQTTYQVFSDGKEWSCPTCHDEADSEGAYDYGIYPPAPANVGPRARLLTQPGGVAELKRQMDEHFTAERAASVAQEGGEHG